MKDIKSNSNVYIVIEILIILSFFILGLGMLWGIKSYHENPKTINDFIFQENEETKEWRWCEKNVNYCTPNHSKTKEESIKDAKNMIKYLQINKNTNWKTK